MEDLCHKRVVNSTKLKLERVDNELDEGKQSLRRDLFGKASPKQPNPFLVERINSVKSGSNKENSPGESQNKASPLKLQQTEIVNPFLNKPEANSRDSKRSKTDIEPETDQITKEEPNTPTLPNPSSSKKLPSGIKTLSSVFTPSELQSLQPTAPKHPVAGTKPAPRRSIRIKETLQNKQKQLQEGGVSENSAEEGKADKGNLKKISKLTKGKYFILGR